MILLVNDDGVDASGLRQLHRALAEGDDEPVLVVAPPSQRSGAGHAITIDRPLAANARLGEQGFAFVVDGTPTDCLKLGLSVLCPEPPRLVVSGINLGPNVGRSLFYSGTVAVALEAAVEGHAAIAASIDAADGGPPGALATAARATAALGRAWLALGPVPGLVLNLNFPALPPAEWRPPMLLPHGLSGFRERYRTIRRDGGELRYQLAGERIEHEHEGDTDAHALSRGHVACTPLSPDLNPRRRGDRRRFARLLEALEASIATVAL